MERDEFTNGVLRSTYKTVMHEVEENIFSSNIWHSRICVVSNIGIFIFSQKDVKAKPELLPWSGTFTMRVLPNNEEIDGKRNLV